MATVLDTAISTESGLLAFPVDLGIDSAGRVFVGDSQSKYVVRWDPDSRSSTIIGRPGQGPGEFGEIVSLRVLGSELLVADPANARIQRFDLDGDLLGQSSLNPLARVSTPYIEADGTLLISSFGSDTSLVRIFDSAGEFVRKVGEPIVIPPGLVRPAEIKAEIARGEVPDLIRNSSLAAGDGAGGLWLAMQAAGEIRRYDSSGTLVWSSPVEDPELSDTRARFFETNAAMQSPGSFMTLQYFADVLPMAPGLWVLLTTAPGGDAVIVVVDEVGRRVRRIEVPGAGGANRFAWDGERRRIWLSTSHDAQLLRAELPSD